MSNTASLRFGWISLFCWSLLGIALETLHAFKIAAFLSDDLTRLLLRLAHAHGGLCALVVLAHHATAREVSGHLLRIGALLLPLGFLLGAIGHPEGDPSIGILLSPVGALLFCAGLVRIALSVWRHNS